MNTNQETNGERLHKFVYKVGEEVVYSGLVDDEGRKYIEKMERWCNGYCYPTGREIVRADLTWETGLEKSVSEENTLNQSSV